MSYNSEKALTLNWELFVTISVTVYRKDDWYLLKLKQIEQLVTSVYNTALRTPTHRRI